MPTIFPPEAGPVISWLRTSQKRPLAIGDLVNVMRVGSHNEEFAEAFCLLQIDQIDAALDEIWPKKGKL